jgi:hypothetical protein
LIPSQILVLFMAPAKRVWKGLVQNLDGARGFQGKKPLKRPEKGSYSAFAV